MTTLTQDPAVTESSLVQRGKDVLISNYARLPVAMVRGEGSWLWDDQGRKYLDLFPGFGGSILGHSHPALIEAAMSQAHHLWHTGNTFYTEPQIEVAERLNAAAFRGKAFFCHSGLEANEAACKLARIRHKDSSPKRYKIISVTKSFHGRSLAMIAATGNPKVKAGFEPAVPGFVMVEQGDIAALEKAIDDETAGVIMEPIQGEGGMNLHTTEYARQVRELCDRHQLTLIFDEVWSGGGRTGQWFAYQHFALSGGIVEPDVMTLGKAMGGGLPVAVMYAKPEIARHFVPGTHGSTLGANAICMAVTRTIFDVIEREKLLEHANRLGEYAIQRLKGEKRLADRVVSVRGRGLMLGMELKQPDEKIVERGLTRGVILNLTAQKVVRLAPAINISRQEWERGLELVIETIAAG